MLGGSAVSRVSLQPLKRIIFVPTPKTKNKAVTCFIVVGWFAWLNLKNMAWMCLWFWRHYSRGQQHCGWEFCEGVAGKLARDIHRFLLKFLTYFISVQGFLLINTTTSMTWLWLFPRMCGSTYTTGKHAPNCCLSSILSSAHPYLDNTVDTVRVIGLYLVRHFYIAFFKCVTKEFFFLF